MLDTQFVRDNAEAVKKAVTDKGMSVDVDVFLTLDTERLDLLRQVEDLKAQKNDLSDQVKNATPEDRVALIEFSKEIKVKLEDLEPQYKKVQDAWYELAVQLPTVPATDVPVGLTEEENVEVMRHGDIPEFDFEVKNHIEIGEALGIINFDQGVKVSGYRGYYLVGDGAMLQMALMMYALQKMVVRGYMPIIPPTILKEFALFGSGYFKGVGYDPEEDEVYKLATSTKEASGEVVKESKFLAGTSEPALLAYYADQVLEGKTLPLRVCGFSPCYRSEIGSYGKDTKGMYRVHEFMKIEQVVIAPADIDMAEELQKEMVGISEEIHAELGLPYRKLAICTGDMGAGKYRQFDLEAWMPGLDRWGETGSASNFKDWQSRRLNIRYRNDEDSLEHAYLLNNTALPSARPLIAILENFQQEDGSVEIPEVLRQYMGGKSRIEKQK